MSSWRCKNSVPKKYFCPKYLYTQIKCILFRIKKIGSFSFMPPWCSKVESKMASSILDKKLSVSVTKQGVLYIIIMINTVQIN